MKETHYILVHEDKTDGWFLINIESRKQWHDLKGLNKFKKTWNKTNKKKKPVKLKSYIQQRETPNNGEIKSY